MGTTRMVPYTVEVATDNGHWTPCEWRVRSRGRIPADGQPSTANLKAWALGYEASTQPGGVNDHIGPTKILAAQIRDQRTGSICATYTRGVA